MSLIDLPTAREHLRVPLDYPEAQVALYLNAAERLVAEFLNRRIYATQADLDAAIADVPVALAAARAQHAAALETAAAIDDPVTQDAAREHAERVYARAKTLARELYDGLVLNDSIAAAVLLTMTSLHENRGDEAAPPALPRAAIELAHPFRVGLGA